MYPVGARRRKRIGNGRGKIKAIILSAGQGRRLMPLTERIPKCCLSIHGRTLLEWQLEALRANAFDEVVVVTGFGHEVVEAVVRRQGGQQVRTLHNPFHALSDNLGTCWVARSEMNGEFVLLNGDTVFEPAVLAQLAAGSHEFPITLAVDHKPVYDADDMKIVAHGMRLSRVGKQLGEREVNGESIGMMRFNARGAASFVRSIEAFMARPDGLTRWYLSAIDQLALEGKVGVRMIHGLQWCEVDDQEDLRLAERMVACWDKGSVQAAPPGEGPTTRSGSCADSVFPLPA